MTENERQDRDSQRWLLAWLLILSLGGGCLLSYIFLAHDQGGLLVEIIKAIGFLAGGFGGGFGYSEIRRRRARDQDG